MHDKHIKLEVDLFIIENLEKLAMDRSPVPKGREVLKPQVLVGEQFNSEEPGL